MPKDVYTTKSMTTSGTAVQYPTGAIVAGGSAVDEMDVSKTPFGGDLYLWCQATLASGAGNLSVSLETDDNTAFSSPFTRLSFAVMIGGTDKYREAAIPYLPERYARVVLTPTGTAVFNVVCGIGLGPSTARIS